MVPPRTVFTLCIALTIVFLSSAQELRIDGATEFEASCCRRAWGKVVSGYKALPNFRTPSCSCTVKFVDRLIIGEVEFSGAIGVYDRSRRLIQLLKFSSPVVTEHSRTVPISPTLNYESILVHEFAHHMNFTINPEIHPLVDEAIAGYAQFSYLPEEQRRIMLRELCDFEIDNLRRTTLLRYFDDPRGFLGAGYRYFADSPCRLRDCLRPGEGHYIKDPFFTEAR